MGQASHNHLVCAMLLLLIMLAFGCRTSQAPKFYSLTPIKTEKAAGPSAAVKGGINVTVGPVRMPDYLDRPQIVTRSGNNELKLAEFDRWGGSLDNDMNQVLVENLSILLPRDRYFITRWSPTLASDLPSAYRVEVVVERFEGNLGKTVVLKAQWGVTGEENSPPLTRQSQISEKVRGRGYDDQVAAMGRALEKLSREIAATIKSLPVLKGGASPPH